MEKLLSDKWDNAFLVEATNEGLSYCRRNRLNADKSAIEEIEFFRNNAFFLFDLPALQNFNSAVIVVESNNRNLIFIDKNELVNELDKHKLPDVSDTFAKVSEYISEVGKSVMKRTDSLKVLKISNVFLTQILKEEKLDHVVAILELEKDTVKNKVTI